MRDLTVRTHRSLMTNMSLSPAARVDFGCDKVSEDRFNYHYFALQATVRKGATREELDNALGNGEKLTALVRKYSPRSTIVFTTTWDHLRESAQKGIDELEAKDSLTEQEQSELEEMRNEIKYI